MYGNLNVLDRLTGFTVPFVAMKIIQWIDANGKAIELTYVNDRISRAWFNTTDGLREVNLYTHGVLNLGVITHIYTSPLLFSQSKNTHFSPLELRFSSVNCSCIHAVVNQKKQILRAILVSVSKLR